MKLKLENHANGFLCLMMIIAYLYGIGMGEYKIDVFGEINVTIH